MLNENYRKVTIKQISNGFILIHWNGTEDVVTYCADMSELSREIEKHYHI